MADTTIKYVNHDNLRTFLDNIKKLHEWEVLADITISEAVNSISGISVSGYDNLMVVASCVNTTNSSAKAGSVIFTDENGTTYQFPVWTNFFTVAAQTTAGMAQFKLTDEWIICPVASRHINYSTFLSSTEGGTASSLSPVGSGALKCTNAVSTLAVSSLDQNSSYFLQAGSRVIVWGWKA